MASPPYYHFTAVETGRTMYPRLYKPQQNNLLEAGHSAKLQWACPVLFLLLKFLCRSCPCG